MAFALPSSSFRFRMSSRAALSSLLFTFAVSASAATSSTPPQGGLLIPVAAGTALAPSTTAFAVPLYDLPAASGATVGALASLTSTTLTVTNAGWTAGALASTAFPYAVQLTSGTAAGQLLTITANTATTLTVSGGDPVALGVVAGDRFRLIPVDTLNSLFGSNTLLGGPTAAAADNVILSTTAQTAYYYNTTLGRWVRTTGPTTDRGNTPIPALGMISIVRKSAALTLAFTGSVPTERTRLAVPNSGSIYLHSGFPVDLTLGTLAIQTALPGWVSGATAATADTLSVVSGANRVSYYHNGTAWVRTTGPATNRNTTAIPAGTPMVLTRVGSAAGSSLLTLNRPYSL